MANQVWVGAAQLGGIQLNETREEVVERLIQLLDDAADAGCAIVIFPELTLTTFFPRYWSDSEEGMDQYFEREMPNDAVRPLFAKARERNIAFTLGYAELTEDGHHYNSVCAVDGGGEVVGIYRKIHLPGHADNRDGPYQHLEKRYFEIGDKGFPVVPLAGINVGLAICNDRRWAETYRILALKGADLIAIGYNTPTTSVPGVNPEHHRAMNEHLLSVRAGAYQNAVWVIATGKSGDEDGHKLIGGSCVVAPSGDVVSLATGDRDELITARYDAAIAEPYREETFNFGKHRLPDHYSLITEQKDRVDTAGAVRVETCPGSR